MLKTTNTNQMHFFCLFLVLDQKSWYFVWKGKERKKEIGVDRGLKNLE